MRKTIIFGTGEIAELACYYFENDPGSNVSIVGFTVDDDYVKSDKFLEKPVIPLSKINTKFPPNKYSAHVALSYTKLNRLRQEKYHLMKSLGYRLESYVCSKSVFWNDLSHGDNCFILENQTIQPTVKIGNNVMIWSTNHLGHNCEIKDHVYLASGITVSGHTIIGERTFVGVNTAFKDFIEIGSDCFITMGSNILRSIPPNSTATSKEVFPEDHLANKKLKKKYFNL